MTGTPTRGAGGHAAKDVYLAATSLAACGGVAVSLRYWRTPAPRGWIILGLFLALAVLAQHFPLALALATR